MELTATTDQRAPDLRRAVDDLRTHSGLDVAGALASNRLAQREAKAPEPWRAEKKRLTRERIADAAIALFAERGYDAVRVPEVAREAQVSAKTLYNYFPTKESLVFDEPSADTEQIEAALRDAPAGASPVDTVLAYLQREVESIKSYPLAALDFLRVVRALVETTPELRAYDLELREQRIQRAQAVLAERAGQAVTDPKPRVVARALSTLWDAEGFATPHIARGLKGDALRRAILSDATIVASLLRAGL